MSRIVACDNGTIDAPNTPCSVRNSTISVSDSAVPHSIDETVKPTRATMKRFLRPKRADNQPTGGVMMAAAAIYDVRIR
jgi:hypothetical protein